MSYLSKLVLYPFVKHTWKINIDVSQCNYVILLGLVYVYILFSFLLFIA